MGDRQWALSEQSKRVVLSSVSKSLFVANSSGWAGLGLQLRKRLVSRQRSQTQPFHHEERSYYHLGCPQFQSLSRAPMVLVLDEFISTSNPPSSKNPSAAPPHWKYHVSGCHHEELPFLDQPGLSSVSLIEPRLKGRFCVLAWPTRTSSHSV